jgi:transposase InsO family protein
MHRELRTTRQNLCQQKPNPAHQADADRRDRALAKEEVSQPVKILRREPLEALQPTVEELPPKSPWRQSEIKPAAIDIAMIGAAGFHRNLKDKSNTLFTASLYEIDRIIDDKLQAEYAESDNRVEQELPAEYAEFADVFSKRASDQLPPHRPYDHQIQLEADNTLGYSPLYNQSVEELLAVKKYLNENLKKGFIVDSQTPFASPTLFVKKPNGSLRFCIDFRKLNALTRKDRYPLPLIDETFARLSRAKKFTKLDIRQAFHRIRMHPDSEDLTTFRTRYGAYKCKVLPFGLTNGPATYQRYMNDVLFDYLDDFCTAYLDDILIYSENEEEHELHVKKVLQRLREAGLQVDIAKSEFSVTKTKYLGFIISTDGIEVDPDKIEVIQTWEPPTTVKGIQSFLGFCNFYRRFIRDYGRIAKPLSNLGRKDIPFVFNATCLDAFGELKQRLTSTPILAHYDMSRESILETDASNGVVGGVLSQKQSDDLFHPVAYFSKTMAPAECNYEIHDKEMLAIVRALEHWRAELIGLQTQLPIYSDHKALEYFMTKRQLTARQARWAELLSQYHFRIEYRTGKSNERADALTRRSQDNQDKTMAQNRTQALLQPSQLDPRIVADLAELAPVEANEPLTIEADIVNRILAANRSDALEMVELRLQMADSTDWKLENGLLQYKNRLFVPEADNLRTYIIREAHNQISTAHPGQNKTIKILRSRYYWPKMSTHIRQYIRNCAACQRSTVPRDKTPGLLQPLPIPERPWQHISMDFKSFPPDKSGHDMIFVVVDRLSKRSYSIPCYKTTTAKDMARLFIIYIWRTHGPPDTIVSDRGRQFISAFWHEFCCILGIKLKLSTADHPQTDGQTEIVNQYIDQRLRPFINYYQDNWSELLPMIDYAQATLPHESIGLSPFQVEFGFEPRTSFDWNRPRAGKPLTAREKLSIDEAQAFSRRMQDAWDIARSNMEKAQLQQKRQANRHRRDVDFEEGDFVWVSNKTWITDLVRSSDQ